MLHGYLRRPSRRGRDSRAEFLTTARILSLTGQLVAGISRERIDFSFLAVLLTMHLEFDSVPLPFFVASFSARSSLFPPIPRLPPSSPMNAFGSQERSFSSFRNATLPLFSRRISLIFCFLFQVLRTTVQSGLQAFCEFERNQLFEILEIVIRKESVQNGK